MKTIGLIGGMSWESSMLYYQIINETVKVRKGGHHSAKSLLYSVDFQEIKDLQHQGNWAEATKVMIESAQTLEAGGADVIVICTNTMHKMAPEVIYDTTRLHAEAAVDFALGDEEQNDANAAFEGR